MRRVGDPLVTVDSLSYSYPYFGTEEKRQALSCVNLEIQTGERVVIVGPSGSGKSTLIQTFIGLIPHSRSGKMQGRVTVDGVDTSVTTVPLLSKTVGFVFQDPDHQMVTSEVDSELAFGPEQSGLDPEIIEERISRVAGMLKMEHLRGREISDLSWGERQKVAIASVLVMRPKMVVLDEPLSGLDMDSAARLLDHLGTIVKTWNIAVVIVEHRLDLLKDFMDRVVVMDDGRIVYDGPVVDYSAEAMIPHPGETGRVLHAGVACSSEPFLPEVCFSESYLSRTDAPQTHTSELHSHPEGVSPIIEVTDVSYTYPNSEKPVLNGVSAAFNPGEVVFICGPNGSGKSTFIKHLNGILRPDTGCVLVSGVDIGGKTVAENAATVSLVGQHADYQLFEETIERELAFGPRNLGMEEGAIDCSIDEIMELMDMTHLGRKGRPLKLSMGEKQRVAIASHLVMKTPVIVLDEPTLGLDINLKLHLASLIIDLKKRGKTVIVVTHDQEFARLCADRFIRFQEGFLV
ncbi:energy-coupling factor ABC transporter ATP-binding protein [Methanogenium marinum]|uniref:Energy-coupling factor ABC transporter ATP-binding protein n=1 Tax=Methanogenium marinum TaxID=348610 RepID=A0A9Q4PYW7_9EURY|nr:ABC transporter ATP-binding protein [Methanogenium marinum]MDE4908832.1 energy-coupling factor ABC transporter ATP-binding protein [Methanogenium marinum]